MFETITRRTGRALLLALAACLVAGGLVGLSAAPSQATLRSLSTDWERDLGWCHHPGAELYTGDFNGDDRDDMLCHDSGNGYKWIALAKGNGHFTGTDWERNLGWCHHPGAELYIGDFNRDKRDDMLCHDNGNGYKWVALAKGHGSFTGTDWERNLGWCHHAGAELYIGDFNRDRRDDMLCHDNGNGYKWVALARGNGHFNNGTDWHGPMHWCYHAQAELHIGDFNRDRRDDLLCHDRGNGYKWISYSDL